MATTRLNLVRSNPEQHVPSHIVAVEAGPGDGAGTGPSPTSTAGPAGARQRARSLLSRGPPIATRAHASIADYHYESPDEDHVPSFLTQPQQTEAAQTQTQLHSQPQPQPQPRLQQAEQQHHQLQQIGSMPGTQPTNTSPSWQPFHPYLAPSPNPSPTGHMISHSPLFSFNASNSGLDELVCKPEHGLPGHKVSLKDRIACYQWTYFTMVCPPGQIRSLAFNHFNHEEEKELLEYY